MANKKKPAAQYNQLIKAYAIKSNEFITHHPRLVMSGIFCIAFILRLGLLLQLKEAPYFNHPLGDSAIYYKRALDIINGQWPASIPFHSSPVYPLFIALNLIISNTSFFFLRLAQIVIGSINCVIIYLISKEMISSKEKGWSIAAGVIAALYGVMAFFDVDLLMIFLTVTAVNGSLLLLMKSNKQRHWAYLICSGLLFGLAVLDKTNLLLCLPVMVAYMAQFKKPSLTWPWKRISLWMTGVLLMVMPVTLYNYIVEKDIVLVASNGGVNLYIGNNEEGQGLFHLPDGSGLSNLDLGGSSVKAANEATQKKLKPSQVSRYWAAKALKWMKNNPEEVAGLYLKKIIYIWNVEEIPNHLNYKFIKVEFAPLLGLFIFGFGLVAPAGITALLGRIKKWSQNEKLMVLFILVYCLSLLPFFITARYRLPVVPLLIAAIPLLFLEIKEIIIKRQWRRLTALIAILLGTAMFIHQRPPQVMTYTHNRVAIAGSYLERAVSNKVTGSKDIEKAIVEFKRAQEVEPLSEDAHFNLGRAYEAVGYYTGALKEYERTEQINPGREKAIRPLIALMKEHIVKRGDQISSRQLPLTLYEAALIKQRQGDRHNAQLLLQQVIKQDPYHLKAYSGLAMIELQQKHFKRAIGYYKQALYYSPKHFILLNNLAGVYYQAGHVKKAEAIYRYCLKLRPDEPLIIKQLEKIKAEQ